MNVKQYRIEQLRKSRITQIAQDSKGQLIRACVMYSNEDLEDYDHAVSFIEDMLWALNELKSDYDIAMSDDFGRE